jgi:hypothetical protein
LHVTPGQAYGRNDWPYDLCVETGNCWASNIFLEQHGEYECRSSIEQETCLFAPYPSGYGALVSRPVDFEGEINDSRAPDSAPLTWWLQLAVKIQLKSWNSTIRSLSLLLFTNFGFFDKTRQETYERYFWVPSDRATVSWYTGRMPDTGTLLRDRLHVHQYVHVESFFFFASPEQLKMDQTWESKMGEPVDLKEIGYSSFAELKSVLMSTVSNVPGVPGRNVGDVNAPSLICSACRDLENVEGFEFDRKGSLTCNPWSFRKGDPYTVIAFLNATRNPVGPHKPNNIPTQTPMHFSHFWVYEAEDGKSRYDVHITENRLSEVDFPSLSFGQGM